MNFLLLLLGMVMLSSTDTAAASTPEASLAFFRDLAETRDYTLGRPLNPVLTPDGSQVLFLRSEARNPVNHLFAMDTATGNVTRLLTPEALLNGQSEQLTAEEKARRERMRMSLRGFTSFALSQDGKRILLPYSGRLFVLDRLSGKLTALPDASEAWLDPKFSPDGQKVAAVNARELWVIDIASGTARALTSGSTDTLSHGSAEFVAQEEMDRYDGYWWSPDSRFLAYQETDDSQVERLYIADPLHPERAPEAFAYPRAGTPNAVVRLAVIPVEGGPSTWIHWDNARYPYLAQVVWKKGGPLTLLVQTRSQQEELLLAANPTDGSTRELLRETDTTWLNLDKNGEMPVWLDDGSGFFWSTERRGAWQLELRTATGALKKELTPLDLGFTDLISFDSHRQELIVAGGSDARDQQLFRVSLKKGSVEPLTRQPGFHRASYSAEGSHYVYTASLLDGSFVCEVRSRDGKVLAIIPSVAEKAPFLPKTEFLQVSDGERTYDAVVVRPRDFVAGQKYPVLLSVYAGPGVKKVLHLPSMYYRSQWQADQGFVVVSLDGRGTPGKGRSWERAIHGNLIDIPLADQISGLKAVGARLPELDLDRVAVTGWSFGGYFSAHAVLQRPDIFRCAVAGAPVTDFADYDTHYTERYLGLPSENVEGYKASNALTYAARLSRPLLLIHGLTDDNVYALHTLKLSQALFAEGRDHDLFFLTGTHMISDPLQTLRLQTRIIEYLKANLEK